MSVLFVISLRNPNPISLIDRVSGTYVTTSTCPNPPAPAIHILHSAFHCVTTVWHNYFYFLKAWPQSQTCWTWILRRFWFGPHAEEAVATTTLNARLVFLLPRSQNRCMRPWGRTQSARQSFSVTSRKSGLWNITINCGKLFFYRKNCQPLYYKLITRAVGYGHIQVVKWEQNVRQLSKNSLCEKYPRMFSQA